MFFDGSKMLNGSGAGVVLVSPRGDKLRYVLQIHFDSSNNEAEYEALLYGLRMAISLGVRRLMVYGDSDLVVNQVIVGRQKPGYDWLLQCSKKARKEVRGVRASSHPPTKKSSS